MDKSCGEKTLFFPDKASNKYTKFEDINSSSPNNCKRQGSQESHTSIQIISDSNYKTIAKTNYTDIIFDQNGIILNNNINSNSNINTSANINADNGIFNGDVEANNTILLGDLTSTTSYITTNMKVGETATINELIVQSNAQINGLLLANNIDAIGLKIKDIGVEHVNVEHVNANNIKCPLIETQAIVSSIIANNNSCVYIPNIRYNVDITNTPLINSIALKNAKIFVVDHNVVLNSDESCNGIEIIIYNSNCNCSIIVRDQCCVICNIAPKQSSKMVYLFIDNKWICA